MFPGAFCEAERCVYATNWSHPAASAGPAAPVAAWLGESEQRLSRRELLPGRIQVFKHLPLWRKVKFHPRLRWLPPRSCISRALPGQDQTQSQVLLLQKHLSYPKRCRLAVPAAGQQERMLPCAESPRVPGQRYRERSSGLCRAGTLQHGPLAGGNRQDLHFPGGFEPRVVSGGARTG